MMAPEGDWAGGVVLRLSRTSWKCLVERLADFLL